MTPRVHATGLSAVLALALACAQGKPPPRATAASAPGRTVAVANAPGAQPPQEAVQDWSYSSAGKRDPFRSYLADVAETTKESVLTRCNTPLGRFDVDQLKVVAVVTGLADPVAMVEAPNGIGYTLRRGSCIGRNGGVVSTVRTGEVIVSEWIVRADGRRERAQTLLRLPKEAALNIEE